MKKMVWGFVAIGPLTAAILLAPCFFLRSSRGPAERSPTASLKTIASAQADYRGNDRDGNKIQDFWREDVSGLYGVLPVLSTDMIKLIELSVAGADDTPAGYAILGDTGPGNVALDQYTVPAPKAGYYFRTLRHADEDPNALDAFNRFAACTYPADYPRTGKWTFIIDERNTIFQRDTGGFPPDVYPDPATLKRDWSRVD